MKADSFDSDTAGRYALNEDTTSGGGGFGLAFALPFPFESAFAFFAAD